MLANSVIVCIAEENNKPHLYYTDVSSPASVVLKYSVESIIGESADGIKISEIKGVYPGIVLNKNGKHFVVLLEPAGYKLVQYSVPENANSFCTLEHEDKSIFLYSVPTASSVS